jgi:hypothetical protein
MKFIFNCFVEFVFIFGYPPRQHLLNDAPMIGRIFFHSEKDAIASIINGIHCERLSFKPPEFSEVELAKATTGFDKAGKVYDFGEVYLHRFSIRRKTSTIFMLTFDNEKKKVVHNKTIGKSFYISGHGCISKSRARFNKPYFSLKAAGLIFRPNILI